MLTMVERDDREKLEIQLTLNLHKNQWILWHWFFDGDFKVVKLQGKKRWEKLGWASKFFNQKFSHYIALFGTLWKTRNISLMHKSPQQFPMNPIFLND